MKVVINRRYGGFGLSTAAEQMLGIQEDSYRYEKLRHDPKLVETVETLGAKANGRFADLYIVEIPDGTDYQVLEYDGFESIVARQYLWPESDRDESTL